MDINKKRQSSQLPKNSLALHNTAMEYKCEVSRNKRAKRRYKNIIEDLGAMEITLNDLADGVKNREIIDAIIDNRGTLDDLVILQQYANAIVHADTRSAEFLRDTSGQKPTNNIDLVTNGGGLAQMSLEELQALRDEMSLVKEGLAQDEE